MAPFPLIMQCSSHFHAAFPGPKVRIHSHFLPVGPRKCLGPLGHTRFSVMQPLSLFASLASGERLASLFQQPQNATEHLPSTCFLNEKRSRETCDSPKASELVGSRTDLYLVKIDRKPLVDSFHLCVCTPLHVQCVTHCLVQDKCL